MKKIIDLSVHQLVDLSLRSGSIDERVFNQGTLSEGTLIHQYYQKQQKSNYYPEVSLSRIFEYRNLTINLHGRCDGLIKNEDGSFTIFIEENLSQVERQKEFLHAVSHIIGEDFSKFDVQKIEQFAHEVDCSESLIKKLQVL